MNRAYEIEAVDVDRAAKVILSRGIVKQATPVWDHHFPGFPILPGVLMLDLMKSTARRWYDVEDLRLKQVRRVRFSNYLKPGAAWESRMRFESSDSEGDRWSGEIFSAGVKMASAILTLSMK